MNRHLTEVNKPKKRLRIFHGRMYFALQALAGAAWWLGTAMIPGVAAATLGSINPLLIAIVDIPLFVIGSALAALNFRWAVWIATAWTVLVALGMVIYATATTEAGLGAVLMVLAALGSLLAGMLMIVGRIPSEKLLVGPFAFHSSHTRIRSRLLMHTTIQIVVFWGVFLIIIPVIINSFEDRWNLAYKFPILLIVVGFALLAVSSVIGVWSARAIANFGSGTPLPSQMAHHLVARGPYAFVRNPMAIAGVVQGMAMGLLIGSWLVIVYALIGSLLWNWLIRPHEEADLIERFGDEYRDYAKRVRCWWPTFSTAESTSDLVDED
ncbi:Protein-S-isoprenylcysteine O-methyltransferase Ste14 [Brevibacterium siliguriense]|uniref:Protein-S-isoprenylcysteine O-methyltransferase Ste14 n=1 Tax=Brevibacterium siliguriense TaxID=1136497 RepID=A0A1H1MK82_9MICO|nr:isoprenylcysteine carboxylmethyltransferase family protein [Brevibacterium siliguriense]SDR87067.1 Protein-S-isoprenylcysteine O-methyltransferase Ste14 [Brevibacterium siliguriense]